MDTSASNKTPKGITGANIRGVIDVFKLDILLPPYNLYFIRMNKKKDIIKDIDKVIKQRATLEKASVFMSTIYLVMNTERTTNKAIVMFKFIINTSLILI